MMNRNKRFLIKQELLWTMFIIYVSGYKVIEKESRGG